MKPKPCKHCWHASKKTGNYTEHGSYTTYAITPVSSPPPVTIDICCWCGKERI